MIATSFAGLVLAVAAMLVGWELTRELRGELREAARYLAARRLRRRHAADRANLKAGIVRVGDAQVGPDSIILGEDWLFDTSNGAPVHSVGPDGLPRFCGYTVAELKEVHARRAEFNVNA